MRAKVGAFIDTAAACFRAATGRRSFLDGLADEQDAANREMRQLKRARRILDAIHDHPGRVSLGGELQAIADEMMRQYRATPFWRRWSGWLVERWRRARWLLGEWRARR